MKINFNMSAVISNDCLAKSEDGLSNSIYKLSSGYKINQAKDSPSGIAIAKRMNAQIRGLSKANQNANEGVSVVEIADGALTEVHDMLQRLNELSIKAANGTMSDGSELDPAKEMTYKDREAVQEEVDALLEEIDRIANTTEFNGKVLLNGNFDLKGFVEISKAKQLTDSNGTVYAATATPTPQNVASAIKVASYSESSEVGYYEVAIKVNEDKDGQKYVESVYIGNEHDKAEIRDKDWELKKVENQKLGAQEIWLDESGNAEASTVTVKADGGFSLTLDVDLTQFSAGDIAIVNVDLTGIGPMTMQIGPSEGQTLDILIPTVSSKALGVKDLDVGTEEKATESIDRVSNAISNLSVIRSKLGAYQNRLEHTISSLDVSEENMTAAYSRIMDVDMAEEMSEYTKYQVLTQAGTSMLAQANERPSQILQLLQ